MKEMPFVLQLFLVVMALTILGAITSLITTEIRDCIDWWEKRKQGRLAHEIMHEEARLRLQLLVKQAMAEQFKDQNRQVWPQ